MQYHFERNADGSCRVYDNGRQIADGIPESTARQTCAAYNRAAKRGPGMGTWLLVLLTAIGVTTCMLRAPTLTPEQAEKIEQIRLRDAALMRECRARGFPEANCQKLREEVRRLQR